MFNEPVKIVKGTRIFVSPCRGDPSGRGKRQFTAYANYVTATLSTRGEVSGEDKMKAADAVKKNGNAMVLPFPLNNTNKIQSPPLTLINLSGAPTCLHDLEKVFPRAPPTKSRAARASRSLQQQTIPVVKCGSYKCSAALSLAELDQVGSITHVAPVNHYWSMLSNNSRF
jgi:hypothetical protein